jgi:hypothetical protein
MTAIYYSGIVLVSVPLILVFIYAAVGIGAAAYFRARDRHIRDRNTTCRLLPHVME